MALPKHADRVTIRKIFMAITMQQHLQDFGRGRACWHSFGNENKPPLVLCAANGVPAAAYQPFVQPFANNYHCFLYNNRSQWPQQTRPPAGWCWRDHAADFKAFFDTVVQQPALGIGHSLGASILTLVACEQPQCLSRLVMIDPATLGSRILLGFMRYTPMLLRRRTGIVQSTLRRRRHWPNRAAFIDDMRSNAVYRAFSERALRLCAEYGLDATADGVQLRCSPKWEAHNYATIMNLWQYLPKLTMPSLFLRTEYSNLYTQAQQQRARRRYKSAVTFAQIPAAGHMAPLEQAELVQRMIEQWLPAVPATQHSEPAPASARSAP